MGSNKKLFSFHRGTGWTQIGLTPLLHNLNILTSDTIEFLLVTCARIYVHRNVCITYIWKNCLEIETGPWKTSLVSLIDWVRLLQCGILVLVWLAQTSGLPLPPEFAPLDLEWLALCWRRLVLWTRPEKKVYRCVWLREEFNIKRCPIRSLSLPPL